MTKNTSTIIDNLQFNSEEWDELQKDFSNNETKHIICAKFNLKGFQFKALKKYYIGNLDEI